MKRFLVVRKGQSLLKSGEFISAHTLEGAKWKLQNRGDDPEEFYLHQNMWGGVEMGCFEIKKGGCDK